MPKTPGLEPPGPDGGAAERMRQFEEARGIEPDVGTPTDDALEEEEATEEPADETTDGYLDEATPDDPGSEGGEGSA